MQDKAERRDIREGWDAPDVDETQRVGPWAWLANGLGTPADRSNHRRFVAWTCAWMVAFTAALQTLKGNLRVLGLEVGGSAAWVLAVLPNVLAAGALLAYLRFLRMADELTRLIQLQALAVGFGAWLFYYMAWELLEGAGAPPLGNDAPIVVPAFAMAFGQLYFAWRYR